MSSAVTAQLVLQLQQQGSCIELLAASRTKTLLEFVHGGSSRYRARGLREVAEPGGEVVELDQDCTAGLCAQWLGLPKALASPGQHQQLATRRVHVFRRQVSSDAFARVTVSSRSGQFRHPVDREIL